MGSLQLAKHARELVLTNKPARLYRSIIREVPRVMAIFDIVHMTEDGVKDSIRKHFYGHAKIKDERVIDKLLETGYYDLEDTLLQHKQKNHVMLLLDGPTNTEFNSKRLGVNATEDEQFQRSINP